jgi:hypothetical protein
MAQPKAKWRNLQLSSRVLSTVVLSLALAGQSLMAHDPHDPIVTVVASPNFAQDSTVFMVTGYLSVKVDQCRCYLVASGRLAGRATDVWHRLFAGVRPGSDYFRG